MLALAALMLFGAACEDDPLLIEDQSEASPEVVEPSFITPLPSATLTGDPIAGAATPEAASRALIGYWLADDEAAAQSVANPEAVAQLFAEPAGDPTFKECAPEGALFVCTFPSADETIDMTVQTVPPGSYIVTEVLFTEEG